MGGPRELVKEGCKHTPCSVPGTIFCLGALLLGCILESGSQEGGSYPFEHFYLTRGERGCLAKFSIGLGFSHWLKGGRERHPKL